MANTTGQELRKAREARSLTLEQVSRAIYIRVHYLQALEAGRLEDLPSLAQARGFIRSYAGYLGLNAEQLLKELDSSREPAPEPAQVGKANPPPSPAPQPAAARAAQQSAAIYAEAAAIFADVGRQLRQQRELLGLSIDDVERHTHLRRHYLRALEAGDLQALPSPVQGRGMLSNYAVFLGLDPEPLLLRFAEGLQTRLASRQPVQELETPEKARPPRPAAPLPRPLRRLLSPDMLIGGTFAIFLVVFVVWGSVRIFSLQSDGQATQSAPSIADVLLATTSPTATATLEQPAGAVAQTNSELTVVDTPAPVVEEPGESTPAGPAPLGVNVYITVRERAWLRATVDGKIQFEGRVIPGSAYSFVGEKQVEVYTGNAAALQIFFNEQDLGLLGNFGQIVNRVFTPFGAQTPTPTITPTLTPTVTPSPSPTPTLTPPPGGGFEAPPATVPALP